MKSIILVLTIAMFALVSVAETFGKQTLAPAVTGSDKVATVRVKGRGEGETKDEALKDAYRDAIERAVGMYVDSEQLVDNDRLIRDQVLTHSNAYIDKYEEVNLLNRKGLLKIEIIAWVRKQALTQRLREVMPTMTVNVSKINQNLYAQIVTEDKRDMDAEALLKAEFDNFDPLAQLVKVTIVNEKPEVSQSKESDDSKILSYQLKFQIDPDKYFKVWAPRMDQILTQISMSPGKPFNFKREKTCVDKWSEFAEYDCRELTKAEYFAYNKMWFISARLLDGNRFVVGEDYVHDFYASEVISAISNTPLRDTWNSEHRFIRRWGVAKQMKAKRKLYVALVKRTNQSGVSGNLYELSERSASVLSDWMSRYSGLKEGRRSSDKTGRTTSYQVAFKDVSGEEITCQGCLAYNHDMSNIGCICWGKDENSDDRNRPGNTIPYVIYMTPFIGCFAGECSTWIDVEVAKEDVARISTISIAAESNH